jgi:dienelactone hydrolase
MKHPIDLSVVAILKAGPRDVRFFTDGWGSEELLHPPDLAGLADESLPVHWLTSRDALDVVVTHGAFASPASNLPERASRGSVMLVEPHGGTERIVVLMPAWNEHEPHVRVALARRLAARGISSVILENAFFGSRHPDPAEGHPIRTVADFMVMGESAVTEARGILTWLRSTGRHVGVAGYSMGGNTAALVAASLPFPLAAAPMAASHSPSPVFLDGVLRHGISWDALGGIEQAPRLREVLRRVSVLDIPPRAHVETAVIVGARSDAYIPRSATTDLADHWPGAELRWEPGGHASLVWLRKDRLAEAVVDSFDRMYGPAVPSGA